MGLLPCYGDFVPADALDTLYDADHAALVFEDWALLDMQFEKAGELVVAGALGALVADARQFLAERLGVAIAARIGIVGREDAGKDPGREHGGRKARAFLVGPVDELDRRVGLVAG